MQESRTWFATSIVSSSKKYTVSTESYIVSNSIFLTVRLIILPLIWSATRLTTQLTAVRLICYSIICSTIGNIKLSYKSFLLGAGLLSGSCRWTTVVSFF